MLKQLPTEAKSQYPPRLKLALVVVHMGSFMGGYTEGVKESGIMEMQIKCDTDINTLQACILKPFQIKEIMKRVSEKEKNLPHINRFS